jgi:hypothetical protein
MTPNFVRPAPLVPRARLRRSIASAGVLAAGAVLVSACSVPQVASMSKDVSTHAAANPRATATATPSPSATSSPSRAASTASSVANAAVATTSATPVPRGDLVFGSLTHKLNAGDRTLVVNYWTSDNPYKVSASSPMTLQLAAHLEGGNVFSKAEVSRFTAAFDDGTTATTVSDDKGDFALTQPFSYSTAFTLRPSVTTPTLATVTVEFDLLIETQPGSGDFYRQTVLDTLHIAFQASGTSGSQS